VHDKGLTYIVRPQDDGSVTFSVKPGHAKEFNAERAQQHFAKTLSDQKEFEKVRDVVKDAYGKFSDKEGVSQCGRNLRRARFALRALAIVGAGMALSPNADAAQRLKISVTKIEKALQNGECPDEDDKNDVLIAVKDIYGYSSVALWYLKKLDDMCPCCSGGK